MDWKILERIMKTRVMPLYKIYYSIIPSKDIYNHLEPDLANGPGHVDELNKRTGFFTKLEESILRDGMINPILVSLGWAPPRTYEKMPKNIQTSLDKTLICLTTGGSRLWIAQKYNMDVPCIISDYIGKYADQQELKEADIMKYFKQSGRVKVIYGQRGLLIKDLQPFHLR